MDREGVVSGGVLLGGWRRAFRSYEGDDLVWVLSDGWILSTFVSFCLRLGSLCFRIPSVMDSGLCFSVFLFFPFLSFLLGFGFQFPFVFGLVLCFPYSL